MIVLDANVLIAHLDSADTHHDRAGQLLEQTAGEVLSVSVISLAEVFVGPARIGRLPEAQQAIKRLAVVEVGLGPDAAHRLALLRVETRLRLPDCCVLLAAEEHQAAVASFDARLVQAAQTRGRGTYPAPS